MFYKCINFSLAVFSFFKKCFNWLIFTVKQIKFYFLSVSIILSPFWFFTLETFGYTKNYPNWEQEKKPIAIVLGAGIIHNKFPTKILAKRLDAALKLYQQGQITKILVSGDNQIVEYNEPQVMKNYLIQKGVSTENIVMDFAGRRTFDTCWRAKNIFKVTQAYLITQAFHLPRAIFLCRNLGIQTKPIIAEDIQALFNISVYNLIREIPASWIALLDILLKKEAPIKGDGKEQQLSLNFLTFS